MTTTLSFVVPIFFEGSNIESRTILIYHEDKYHGEGTILLPEDLETSAIANQGPYIE